MEQNYVSDPIKNLPASGIRTILDKATAMEKSGRKIIHFEIGRPDFDTPDHIKEAAIEALKEGFVHYTPNTGIPALRDALSKTLKREKNLEYKADSEIIVTAGAQEAIMLMLKVVINSGDEILVPNPGYGPYNSAIILAGGKPVFYSLNDRFGWDEDFVQNMITDKTKAIIVCNPSNPTGAVFSNEELERISDFSKKNDLLVLSDEVYDSLVYDNVKHNSLAVYPDMKDRTFVLNSLSKTYSMTGWRIGYIAASEFMIKMLKLAQQNFMMSVCSFAQKGAVAALNGPQDCVDEMVKSFKERRDVIYNGLKDVEGLKISPVPDGAFYVFLDHRDLKISSLDFVNLLLDKGGVATVPGDFFGSNGAGYIRIAYSASLEDCKKGVEIIKKVIDEEIRK